MSTFEYTDTDPEHEWGFIETKHFKVKSSSRRSFVVIDDFYEDPHAIRQYALGQTYWEGEGAVGWRTRKQFLFDGVKEKFEEALGKKIVEYEEGKHGWRNIGINGRFQAVWADHPTVFHCDSQEYAAVIYLTPDAPYQSGTSFWRHRETGAFHSSHIYKDEETASKVFSKGHLDGTPFDAQDTVGNVFNRAVIFDGKLIHGGVNYFGSSIDTGRLFHIFFFDTE